MHNSLFTIIDTSSRLKEEIVDKHFSLYKKEDPTCAETGLIMFFKSGVHFGALHSEVNLFLSFLIIVFRTF